MIIVSDNDSFRLVSFSLSFSDLHIQWQAISMSVAISLSFSLPVKTYCYMPSNEVLRDELKNVQV